VISSVESTNKKKFIGLKAKGIFASLKIGWITKN